MIENEIITLLLKSLRGEATAEELRQLRRWQAQSDEHRERLDEMRKLWHLLEAEHTMSDIELGQQRERFRQRLIHMQRPRASIAWWPRAAAVVTALVLLGGSLMWWQRYTAHSAQETPLAWQEQRGQVELILSDGQRVNLIQCDTLPSATTREQHIMRQIDGLDYTAVATETAVTETLFNQVATLTGSTYHLKLADGTQVWLNAQSDLRFPVNFCGQERRVYLHGEAYFEVAHDDEHPFLVNIRPGIDIKVYGTHFDVDTYDIDHMRTSLLEGSIGIIDSERDTEFRLKPNETALLNALNGHIDISPCDATDYVQWREGLITFYDEPLCQLMNRLCRLHDIEVCYADDSVRRVPLSGMLHDCDDTDALLETLQTVSGLTFERQGKVVSIAAPH